MLNKEEELGCFEILKNNFPELNRQSLVIGLYEFLQSDVKLEQYICRGGITPHRAAYKYILDKTPYIVMDESEGYKCLFLKGNHVRIHYDISKNKMIRFIEESGSL